MIYAFIYSTDMRDRYAEIKTFRSEKKAIEFAKNFNVELAYPELTKDDLPGYQQNFHHRIISLVEYSGRLPKKQGKELMYEMLRKNGRRIKIDSD